MDKIYNKYSKYENLLNRIQKNISVKEGFFMIMKLYLTNNIFYYILCVIIRFIPLIILSGNYHDAFDPHDIMLKKIKENKDFSDINKYNHYLIYPVSSTKWVRVLTAHKLITALNIDDKKYILFSIILLLLFIIRILFYVYIINGLYNRQITNKWPIPSNIK